MHIKSVQILRFQIRRASIASQACVWLLPSCFSLGIGILALLPLGCIQQTDNQVVVFSALDREFSQNEFDQFSKATAIRVLPKYDTESTKTVGLANQILQQGEGSQCDVFWNNEILHTLRLQKAGLLQTVEISEAQFFSPTFRSPDQQWFGLAARARVFIVNTDLLTDSSQYPSSINALTDPHWAGKACIAKPLFGTTATHFAVLYQIWGKDQFQTFVSQLPTNHVAVVSGNRQVAADVAAGKYAFGLTDTDDYNLEAEAGSPVAMVFPDQDPKLMGTLLIPNTVAVIKGTKNRENAIKLIQYALSGTVETSLATGPSAQFPLDTRLKIRSKLEVQPTPRYLNVDWNRTVEAWQESSKLLKALYY